jgi:hypothetical protein
MAGEDLLEGADGGTNDTTGAKGKKHKPLSKGQKIGVAIGAITILLVVYQIKKGQASSSSSTTASAPIDPQTGYPAGSAQDQAALAQIAASQSAASSAGQYGTGGGGGSWSGGSDGSSSSSGIDPSTGQSYSSEIAANNTALSSLGQDYTTLEQQWSSFTSNPGQSGGVGEETPGNPTGAIGPATPAAPTPTATQSANLVKLEAELNRDEQGTPTAGKTASITTLNKQITAVKNRS